MDSTVEAAATPESPERYVTLDIDVSGNVEARWVYDRENGAVGLLLLRHVE